MSKLIQKQNKLVYYAKNWAAAHLVPRWVLQRYRQSCYALLENTSYAAEVWRRVNYYNKLSSIVSLPASAISVRDVITNTSLMGSAYRYDSYYYLRFFKPDLKLLCFMRDSEKCQQSSPTLLRSRFLRLPLENEVLLKLDKTRHFFQVQDSLFFDKKKEQAVWRGTDYPEHRKQFLRMCQGKAGVDLGQVNDPKKDTYARYLSIQRQLRYRFIVSLEGNDVASNLKWVMSSNSLCLMPRPKFASWFMEDQLQPGVHYVALEEDYANLEEVIAYYSQNPGQALAIIKNANQYVAQFFDQQREDLISLLVLEKYFHCTGQLQSPYAEHFQLT